MPARFYITTPIYYVNALPHVGTAYTTIVADALARYHRLRGHDTHFVTGTDEHGQKIERVARDKQVEPLAYATGVAERFRQAWPPLNIAVDDFIRTTEPRHAARATELWRRIRERGDIYLGEYEGWYCVADEAFYTEKDLVDGLSPTGRPVERVRESSYFFRLSRYTDILLDFYERHPEFVQPEGRYNEVKSFVRGGLEDLSVSRTTFKWGIPVPDDPAHVMYVWFDALTNYWSALGPDGDPLQRFWPPDVHLVGKEIVRFHAVYWPAFLLAAGLPESQLPKRVYAHGWLTSGGRRFTKTAPAPGPGPEAAVAATPRVTQLDPLLIAGEVGADVLRYYLLRAVAFGQDGDFSLDDLVGRLNADLANEDLGNLLNRTLGLCSKLTGGKVPAPGAPGDRERALWEDALQASVKARESFDAFAPHRALEAVWRFCGQANTYVDQAAPWVAAKKNDQGRVDTILATLLEALRWLSIMVAPAMPERATEMRRQLGLPPLSNAVGQDQWPVEWAPQPAGGELSPGQPIFPRVDDDQRRALIERLTRPAGAPGEAGGSTAAQTPAASAAGGLAPAEGSAVAQAALADASAAPGGAAGSPAAGAGAASAAEPPSAAISYDDFAKVDVRVGLVVSAVKVPKKDKLLDLRIDLGEPEPRRIVAGLALSFTPEALVGRRVLVVSNLAPRDFGKGLVSHGMILAAGASEALSLPTIDERVAPGTRLK